mmetsp:Transcript_150029/g.482193  ORF Transcript_150029/g.482193 Transcript_150029/m.482193 type:complete len:524 (+) Transcript_150029:81-1652(+)
MPQPPAAARASKCVPLEVRPGRRPRRTASPAHDAEAPRRTLPSAQRLLAVGARKRAEEGPALEERGVAHEQAIEATKIHVDARRGCNFASDPRDHAEVDILPHPSSPLADAEQNRPHRRVEIDDRRPVVAAAEPTCRAQPAQRHLELGGSDGHTSVLVRVQQHDLLEELKNRLSAQAVHQRPARVPAVVERELLHARRRKAHPQDPEEHPMPKGRQTQRPQAEMRSAQRDEGVKLRHILPHPRQRCPHHQAAGAMGHEAEPPQAGRAFGQGLDEVRDLAGQPHRRHAQVALGVSADVRQHRRRRPRGGEHDAGDQEPGLRRGQREEVAQRTQVVGRRPVARDEHDEVLTWAGDRLLEAAVGRPRPLHEHGAVEARGRRRRQLLHEGGAPLEARGEQAARELLRCDVFALTCTSIPTGADSRHQPSVPPDADGGLLLLVEKALWKRARPHTWRCIARIGARASASLAGALLGGGGDLQLQLDDAEVPVVGVERHRAALPPVAAVAHSEPLGGNLFELSKCRART